MADAAWHAETPDGVRQLRACVHCKLIKTRSQWYKNVCENCTFLLGKYRQEHHSMEYVDSETTSEFDGMVALMDNERSWAAIPLQLRDSVDERGPRRFKPGVYAVKLIVTAADEAVEEERGAEDEPTAEDRAFIAHSDDEAEATFDVNEDD